MAAHIRSVITTSLLACILFCKASSVSSNDGHVTAPPIALTPTPTNNFDTPKKVLILDVDNTLYNEAELKSSHFGIEQQIIENTHKFGEKYFNLSKDQCDELYHEYGATCEGLRHMMANEGKGEVEIEEMMSKFYREVWNGIDVSCLLISSHLASSNTGYSHDKSKKQRQLLIDTLQSIQFPIYIASNSPKRHVLKVLKALGLSQIKIEDILTPDSERDRDVSEPYPTKSSASSFYYPLLQKFDPETYDIILLDDSLTNLKKGGEVGFKGVKVHGEGGKTLKEALSIFLGHIDGLSYIFSDVAYLQSKNEVDLVSINEEVWSTVAKELARIMHDSSTARIIDFGAGLLSMLEMILYGGGGKESLVDLLRKSKVINDIEYVAYESNKNLLDACWNRLYKMGFVGEDKQEERDEYIFNQIVDGVKVVVKLRVKSFTEDTIADSETSPHLIVGCCFADLFDPQDLATAIMRFLKHSTVGQDERDTAESSHETLLYFPITFAGTTQFLPPKPFGVVGESSRIIPSDALAFQVYAQSLINQHGHNLDPRKIIEAMSNSQGKLLTNGSSVWNIDPESNKYLWETMMYFFASSTGPMMSKWDFKGWVNRARSERPKIRVMNQDLLFALSPEMKLVTPEDKNLSIDNSEECKNDSVGEVVEEIIFKSPYSVDKTIKEWDTRNNRHLKPGQIEGKMESRLSSFCPALLIQSSLYI